MQMNKNDKKEHEWSEFISDANLTKKLSKNKEKIAAEICHTGDRYNYNQYKKEQLLQNVDEAIVGTHSYIVDSRLGCQHINAEKYNENSCDTHTIRALQRGKLKIDLRIDLHGYTIKQAQEVFTYVVRNMYANRQKLLLVVTGKNKNTWSSQEQDRNQLTIRSELMNWVRLPEISGYIKYVKQAAERDGGSGAFCILITRKK